jgi:acyl dehydratase
VRLQQALGDVEPVLVHRHRGLDQPRVPSSTHWCLRRHDPHRSVNSSAPLCALAMLYFEDLEVGVETDFGSYDVTREEVLEFARKYDPQPFHLSDEAAAKTHFGRLSASGWHTAAMTMAVIARKVVAEEQAGLGSPGIDELRWLKPVYPGDTLHVCGKIVDKTPSRSKPNIGSFRTETTVTNQDGIPVMRFQSIVLIRRRPSEGAAA